MIVMGVDFEPKRLLHVTARDGILAESGMIGFGATRSAEDVRAFASEFSRIVASVRPDLIHVRSKPEKGQMRAGAAALKMEALVLCLSGCPVRHLSPRSLARIDDNPDLFAYQQGAWKAALAG